MVTYKITKEGFVGNLEGTASYAVSSSIAATANEVNWGNIRGTIGDQTDLMNLIGSIQSDSQTLPVLYIDGGEELRALIVRTDVAAKSVTLPVRVVYQRGTVKRTLYAKIKLQGTSSLAYPKKNFTITFYTDSTLTTKLNLELKAGWGEHAKYCIKANYIDHSHARNICSARLWSQIVATRESNPEELEATPNMGAIDGFPVKMYVNSAYYGLGTINIPKDAWMFNMDKDNELHSILCGENYQAGCFRAVPNIDGSDWSEELRDEPNAGELARWRLATDFIRTSDDETFMSGIENYFNLQSLIDYYIFCYVITGLDNMGKNQIYISYDGLKYYASMYDMDSTFGLYWNGQSFVVATYRCQEDYETMKGGNLGNLLFIRLANCFAEEIVTRYEELRANILSYENIVATFEQFIDQIRPDQYADDIVPYPYIPSVSTNNIWQIRDYVRERLVYVDSKIHLSGVEKVYIFQPGNAYVGNVLPLRAYTLPEDPVSVNLQWSIVEVSGSPSSEPTIDTNTGELTCSDECIATVKLEDLDSRHSTTKSIQILSAASQYESKSATAGEAFTWDTAFDPGKKTISLLFEVTTGNNTQNIISIGDNIGTWAAASGKAKLHLYMDPRQADVNARRLNFDLEFNDTGTNINLRTYIKYLHPYVHLIFNENGLYVNGEMILTRYSISPAVKSSGGTSPTLQNISRWFNLMCPERTFDPVTGEESSIALQVGSTEGVNRSSASYVHARIYDYAMTEEQMKELYYTLPVDEYNTVEAEYSLRSTLFNGTEVEMFNVEPSSMEPYTIKLHFTPTNTSQVAEATVLHMMTEISPWPGVAVMQSGGKYQISLFSERIQLQFGSEEVEHHVVLTSRPSTGGSGNGYLSCIVDNEKVLSKEVAGYQPAYGNNIVLGGYEDSLGQTGRFWKGTVNRFRITKDS